MQLDYNRAILEGERRIFGFPGEEASMAENKNSAARIQANNRYNAKAYDRVNIAIPKGQKDVIKAHAEAHNESVNGFINRAISFTMEADRAAVGRSEDAGRENHA